MTHISKAKIKYVQSLKRKKSRDQHGVFIIEGKKSIDTALDSGLKPHFIVGIESVINQFSTNLLLTATASEMQKMSQFNTPSSVLALFDQWSLTTFEQASMRSNYALYLDRIQDPGNLGTIIRTADWFGIRDVILSAGCADLFNAKTVQATMGSLHAVHFYRDDWPLTTTIDTMALDMHGAQINTFGPPEQGILVIGNEGQGVLEAIKGECSQLIAIDGSSNRKAESLNAAMAGGIAMHWLTTHR